MPSAFKVSSNSDLVFSSIYDTTDETAQLSIKLSQPADYTHVIEPFTKNNFGKIKMKLFLTNECDAVLTKVQHQIEKQLREDFPHLDSFKDATFHNEL